MCFFAEDSLGKEKVQESGLSLAEMVRKLATIEMIVDGSFVSN